MSCCILASLINDTFLKHFVTHLVALFLKGGTAFSVTEILQQSNKDQKGFANINGSEYHNTMKHK